RFAKRERLRGWHEGIRDRIVMAARAAQPDTVPGVENLTLRGRKQHEAHHRGAVRAQARLIPVEDPAIADHPAGVLAAAPERPAARDAITAIDDPGDAERPQGSRRPN